MTDFTGQEEPVRTDEQSLDPQASAIPVAPAATGIALPAAVMPDAVVTTPIDDPDGSVGATGDGGGSLPLDSERRPSQGGGFLDDVRDGLRRLFGRDPD